jgi:hypothetical protein
MRSLSNRVYKFTNVQAIPDQPAAAATKLDATDADTTEAAMIANIYEPAGGYQGCDILNIEMSLNIFGPSTTEVLNIDPQHLTLGFENATSCCKTHYKAMQIWHNGSQNEELEKQISTRNHPRHRWRIYGYHRGHSTYCRQIEGIKLEQLQNHHSAP